MREINNLSDMLPILTYYQESNDYNGIGAHFHGYHELVLVREGTVNFRINQHDYLAGPNSLIIIRAMDKHDVSIRKYPYKRYVFTVTSQLILTAVREPSLLSLFLYHNPNSRNLISLRQEIACRLTAIFEETILECAEKKPLWSSQVITFIHQALIELYREDPDMFSAGDSSSNIQTMMRIQHFISEHFREKIDLDQLAEQFFVSKFHLSRRFKAITGHTFKNYLILHRISEAQQLLRYTNKPVSEICADVGYDNTEHFIRIFHKSQGITPLQYRLYCRDEESSRQKKQETHVF
jgi:AraC-like DNA-binding protein